MSLKVGFLFATLLVGSLAFPFEDDMSIFFDHSETDIGVDTDLTEDTSASARIVGGTTAGGVPHMAALTTGAFTRNLLCGGSVINERYICTAAHCIAAVRSGNNLVSSLRGHVGTNRFATGGTSFIFSSYIIHPSYDSRLIKNDIGFLIAANNLVLSNIVAPVPFSFDFVGAGVPTIVNGWGRIRAGGAFSQVLLELRANTVDGNLCVTQVAQRAVQINMRNVPAVNPNLEICNFRQQGSGTCHGDSGSALLRADNKRQIGVVSWGLPCAQNAPDMFVRVSAYRSWIEQNIR